MGRITSINGRTLMVEFKCGRCGRTHIEPYEQQADEAEGNLQSFYPPKGWKDAERYTPLLCDICTNKYSEFLKGGEEE